MPDLPIGTVTFLFTDVEGSTRLWEESPSGMRTALARLEQLVGAHVEGHDGVLVRPRGEGDSHFAVFARATDAIAAASGLQVALHVESLAVPLKVRIALHTGEADLRDGDYYGSAVNRCARLRGIAHGGQVLVSSATEGLVRDALPEDVSLKDLGEQRLRDLTRSERAYQLCHPELPADFPPLHTLDAYPTNLPLQLTSFVGREREIAEVMRLLQTTRLLTLTGTGGCGKTRLAYQIAADVVDQYPNGVWVTELAALSDPELVPQAVAQALGLREQPGVPILETIQTYLKPRRLLLVLDNCEHLLEACAQLVERLLLASPHLRVLATSRELLGAAGEVAWRVPSLSSPDPKHPPSVAQLAEYEGVRLFVERAQVVQPTFQTTERNATTIAEVVARLDGIPLAIELAAARTRGLSVEQIAARLGDRFGLLTGGRRTALRRQQTLRATIDWSHDLLSEPERVLFRRLAVFQGGWILEAAEAVGAGQWQDVAIEQAEVLDLLLRLVDRSLVITEEVVGEERYRLLETIRQYAQEKLLDSGEMVEVRDRHKAWCLALARRAEPEVVGPDYLAWLDRLETEHDNFRAALGWCLERDVESGLEFVGCLLHFWDDHCHFREGSRWASELLLRSQEGTLARARALRTAGMMARGEGAWERAIELYEENLRLCRQLGDRRELGDSLRLLAQTLGLMGERATAEQMLLEALAIVRRAGNGVVLSETLLYLSSNVQDADLARQYLEESLAIAREVGHLHGVAGRLVDLGSMYLIEGDRGRARALFEEALALSRNERDGWWISTALTYLGHVAMLDGEPARARALHLESLGTMRQIGSGPFVIGLEQMGEVEVSLGAHRRGVRLLGARDAEVQRSHVDWRGHFERRYFREADESALSTARTAVGEEAFARAFAEGQAMTLEQAVEYALQT